MGEVVQAESCFNCWMCIFMCILRTQTAPHPKPRSPNPAVPSKASGNSKRKRENRTRPEHRAVVFGVRQHKRF